MLRILWAVGLLALMFTPSGAAFAKPNSLKISEKTKFYRISGTNAAEFAVSMSKRGPYSRQHRQRAWATASRSMTYQVVRQKSKGLCRVKGARVNLKITYNMPKLASVGRLSRRERSKWKKMYALLNRHERTHGLFYRQFAAKVQKAIRRLKPTRSCRALDKNAKRLVKKMSAQDKERNNRFDRKDRRNYRRMERLFSGV